MGYKFNKGSEWRKWDLHLHTVSSHDYQNNGVSDQNIIDKLIFENVSVVAITDHHYINVERIKNLQKIGEGKITVLPGIEFCSDLGGSESIHFIGIFPENIDILSIWTSIQGKVGLTPKDIKDKGGYENVQCDLVDTCDIIHSLGGISSIHAGSKSNTVESIKNNLLNKMQQKKRILSDCIDILEIGKESDAESYIQKVFPSIGFTLPLIICSDNHNISDYCLKQNLWIKADPTFEGLKQILCEPESRVGIQDSNPESKLSYNIIEKVKFVDNSGIKKFPDYEIGFNPDLNAIIGGKSSGKSLLMHIIAKSLGNDTDTKEYADVLKNVSLEVYYADDPNKKRTPEDRRIIEFLPQLHIERIVRDKSNISANLNRTNYFNNFISELIRQDEEINELFEIHNRTLKESQKILENNIGNWIKLDKDLSQARKELLPLGDKTAISNEIANIQQKVKDLTQKSGLTEEEITLYHDLTESNKKINERIDLLKTNESEIERLTSYLAASISDVIERSIIFETKNDVALELFNEFKLSIKEAISQETRKITEKAIKKQDEITQSKTKLAEELTGNTKQLEPILEKNKIQTEIKSFESSIETEKKKLTIIEEKEKEISNIQGRRDAISFIEYYSNIIAAYNSLKDSINEKVASKWGNEQTKLTLTASSIFDSNTFVDSIGSIINLRSYLENQFEGCGFVASNYIYSEDNHIQNIGKITRSCIKDVNRFDNFKSGRNLEELLRAVLKDCNYIDFDIKKGDDSLCNMSEGKKGIVILQLYLSLSKADYPILIDQPEDNLDNRTVYIELNDYIKQPKILK